MVTLQQFKNATAKFRDTLESGYFHPSMLQGMKPSDREKLKYSGETMLGMDRQQGADLAIYHQWKEFWAMIDKDRIENPFKWKHYYMGGRIELQLKDLVDQIMYQRFIYLLKKYVLVSSLDEIENDERLLLHFAYATWNGAGWFEKFAKALNKSVQLYEGKKEMIFVEAFKARINATNKIGLPNKVIRQQGVNMMTLFKRLNLL